MKSMPAPLVEVSGLTHVYRTGEREIVALRNLGLHLHEGERLGLVGPSGSGKTTLLRILAGFEAPSKGRVLVGGRDLNKLSDSERDHYRRHEVGYLWQRSELGLWPALNVIENLLLPAAGAASERYQLALANGILGALRLTDRRLDRPADLGDGERQRLALAVALANRPRLLLADEPTADLDGAAAEQLLADLGGLLRQLGTSAIVVAHGHELAPYVDRVVSMRSTPAALPFPGSGGGASGGDGRFEHRSPVLTVEAVTESVPRGQDRRPAVHLASLDVREGEVVCVLGRSDSGSSALLTLCGGLDVPASGRVTIAGQDLSQLTQSERETLVQHKVAWVLGGAPPLDLVSAVEIVSLAARIGGASREEAMRLSQAALAAIGLDDRAASQVSLLSGGEQQRVALARALVKAPALIIADEPTAQLDPPTAADILRLIRETADSGIGVLLAAHDRAVVDIADRVLLLEDGSVREVMRRW